MAPFYIQALLYNSPKPPPLGRVRTVELCSDEVARIIKKTIGLPVCLDHRGYSIGRVLDVHVSIDGDILVDLFIDPSSERGARAKQLVASQEYKSVSFGSDALLDKRSLRHSCYYPKEVSIVPNGGVDRAHIMFWGEHVYDLNCNITRYRDVFTKTLSAKPPISTMADSSSSTLENLKPADLTPEQLKEACAVYNVIHSLGVNSKNVHEFTKLATNAIQSNAKELDVFLNGTPDKSKIGIVEYASSILGADEMAQFHDELSRNVVNNISGPSAMIRVSAALLENFLDAKKAGEIAMAEKAAEVKTLTSADMRVSKSAATTERVQTAADINSALIERAFSAHKKPRMNEAAPPISQEAINSEIEKKLKAVKTTVSIE